MYTKEGQGAGDRAWEETLEELNFARASEIVQRVKR